MRTFSALNPKDYTIQDFYASSPMGWELVSGSNGVEITSPTGLQGAVMVQRASNDPAEFLQYDNTPRVNVDTGTYEYVLYRSIKHLFYDNGLFYSGSDPVAESIIGLPNDFYVVSVGQYFYGERIKPGSFELSLDAIPQVVSDDGFGNLIVSSSGTGSYVGNIFYNKGIAVIAQSTASVGSAVTSSGIKIVGGTQVYVDYSSDVKIQRHEINLKLEAGDYNMSFSNPSLRKLYTPSTASVTQRFVDLNIPQSGSGSWSLSTLMSSGVIKPYVTTIGLYNQNYELLAVAKVSTPIQRTFDMEQIFIVRFDT